MTQTDHDLLAAAALLKEKGWCQGDLVDQYGAHCAAGALMEVTGYASKTPEARNRYQTAIYALQTIVGSGVASWNDHPARTATQAILGFERAADSVRAPT